jgi:hypothetical protein
MCGVKFRPRVWPGIRGNLHEVPDRIRRPMIKVDGQWREVSWDAAFRRCTELLAPVIEKYGIGSVTASCPRRGRIPGRCVVSPLDAWLTVTSLQVLSSEC